MSQSTVMSIVPNAGHAFKAMQTHAFVPADSNKLLLEMFGRPDGPYTLSNESLQRNLQPDDILGQYVGRELRLVSQAITAAVANDRSSVMLLMFPIVETLETQFSVAYLEPNMVPWSRVTNFGIPRETTFSQWSESYTTQRKKQMARIEKNFLLDPNYGEPYWKMVLRGLGQNAKMTLTIDAIVQAMEQPFRNMFQDMNKKNSFDHNMLFNAERANFGIAQRNPALFFKALVNSRPNQLPIPFDTVLAPAGVFQQLNANALEGGPIPCERAELDPNTNRILTIQFAGPSSTKRINAGGRTIELIEVPELYCNMQDTSVKVFRPFETTLTYADIVPFETGSGTQQFHGHVRERFDTFAYAMTQQWGSQKRLEFAQALDHCWLYDAKSGKRSAKYESFINTLNNNINKSTSDGIPGEWQRTDDINDEPADGVSTYSADMIKGKTNLLDMHGWRDQFPFATFDPQQRRWRMPLHMGDMHQRQLTNERIRQVAEIFLSGISGEDTSSSVYTDIVELVTSIRRQPWTDGYARALIVANKDYLRTGGSVMSSSAKRHVRDNVPQWTPNEFGSLRLPYIGSTTAANALMFDTYPAGFGSYAGLRTLAVEADKADSLWRIAGEHARRVVGHVERLYASFSQYLSESELVDGRNTAPWFQVDDGGRSVLLDTIVQLHTGQQRPGPIMLAVKEANMDEKKGDGTNKGKPVSPVSIDDAVKTPDAAKKNAEDGVPLDEWVELGDVLTVDSFKQLPQIIAALSEIQKQTEITVQRGDSSTAVKNVGTKVADILKKSILNSIREKSIKTNVATVNALVQAIAAADNNATTNAMLVVLGNIKDVPSKKGDALVPVFDRAARDDALAARKDTSKKSKGDMDAVVWLRAPVEATGDMTGLDILVQAASTKDDQGTDQGYYNVPVDIKAFPHMLNTRLDAAQRPVSFGAPAVDAMDIDEGISGIVSSMLSSVTQAGYDDVSKAAAKRFVQQPSDKDSGMGLAFDSDTLFGPWKARLAWMHANVSDGFLKVAMLAVLLSRNVLQTHKRLALIGAALMRLDFWRTGITVRTAALVRLVRGSSTAFTALARISVTPGFENVVGDVNVVGEMFHGIVWQNRKNIELLMNAVLIQFLGGKGVDYITHPEQLDLKPSESPAGFVMPESENAYRIEYPRQILNDNYYYQDNTVTPSPERKVQYAGFAEHIFGKRMQTFTISNREKAFLWGELKRCMVGERAATYHFSESDRKFSDRRVGSGVTGSIELNTGDAWRAYNGGIFPVSAEDKVAVY